jgi:uncharacterized membrane protein YGL010W
MKSAEAWLEAYGESHQNPVNKALHWVCIPVIMVSLLALLSLLRTPVPGVHGGTLLVVGATVFYAALSIPLAVGMALIGAAMLAAAAGLALLPVPLWASALVVFAAGWIGQFVGHQIEGKRPSFFEDVKFLLIGPMWLLADLYRRVGVRY